MVATETDTSSNTLAPPSSSSASPRSVIAKQGSDRDNVRVGIAHFGVGVFHRSHLAYYMDVLLSDHHVYDWGIVGIEVRGSSRSRRVSQQLNQQDGFYTLVTKAADEETQVRIVQSIVKVLSAPDKPDEVREQLLSPDIRIVSLTITQAGYEMMDAVTDGHGKPDPMLKLDLMAASADDLYPPHSVWGWIVWALNERRLANIAPFTVMSCDNMPHNGDKSKECLLAFVHHCAAYKDDHELHDYIKRYVACPNSMVDRITPATTEEHQGEIEKEYGIRDKLPVVAESWTQWVVTDTAGSFPSGRPPLELLSEAPYNVLLVPDVTPYEYMKQRLLNASHLVISYLGCLCGYEFVYEVMDDKNFSAFLQRFMDDEVTPTLPPVDGIELGDYKTKLRTRFANPHCKDTVMRVGRQGGTKIPKLLLPTIRHRLEHGGSIRCSTLAVAAWLRILNHHDEQGKEIEVQDDKAAQIGLFEAVEKAGKDIRAMIEKAAPVFDDLAHNDTFLDSVHEALESLYSKGAKETLRKWVSDGEKNAA